MIYKTVFLMAWQYRFAECGNENPRSHEVHGKVNCGASVFGQISSDRGRDEFFTVSTHSFDRALPTDEERDFRMSFFRSREPNAVTRSALLAAPLFVLTAAGGTPDVHAAEVISLTQTGCQFLEPEGKDHSYKTSKKADCEAVNADSGGTRLAASETIELKPGKYIFRVTNRNVPYELGFWLRDKDYDWRNPVHKVTKTSVSGGGLHLGKSQDYEVTLKPGEYVYSCPLNPTPNYRLVVSEG